MFITSKANFSRAEYIQNSPYRNKYVVEDDVRHAFKCNICVIESMLVVNARPIVATAAGSTAIFTGILPHYRPFIPDRE